MASRRFWIGLLAASLLSACGKALTSAIPDSSSGGLSANHPIDPVHHLPPGVNVQDISLSPSTVSVAVGSSSTLKVTLKLSNGQTVYDPQLVVWSVADPQAATIDDQGVLTPLSPRVTAVRAQLQGKVAETAVTITPAVYAWQQVPSPTTNDLYGACLISHSEGWVAGAEGTVLHFYGNQWQPYQGEIDPDDTLRSVTFVDPGVGWLVGCKGKPDKPGGVVLYSFDNGNWDPVPVTMSGGLNGVSAQDSNHAWAVGQDGDGKMLILKWDGKAWSRDSSISGSGHLNAVQAIGSQAWAVGAEGDDCVVLHYTGSTWERQNLPVLTGLFESTEFKGLYMINSEQGYAVGWAKPTVGFTKGLIMKYDARGQHRFEWSMWSRLDAADANTQYLDQVPLNGIGMLGGNQGWVIGQTISPKVWVRLNPINDLYGNLLSFDGSTYTIDNTYFKYNLSREFLGIHLLPQGDGLVVGRQGYLMQRNYDWRQSSTPTYNSGDNTAPVPGTTF